MTKNRLLPAVLAAATAIATPALAQNRHEPHGNGQPAPRAQERRSASSQERAAAQNRGGVTQGRAVTQDRAVPRAVPRSETRGNVAPRYENRGYATQAPRYDNRAYAAPHAVRPYVAGPYGAHPYSAHPYYYHPYGAHAYYGPYLGPAYVFRPHTYLRFGIVLGYPVPYAYAYPYPVPVYGYGAPPAPVVVGPSSTQYGGVALQFSPSEAAVYVDGNYAGTVHDFDGSTNTLTLTAGRHHIEITAQSYETVAIDVDVTPGQIVPYQGSLRPF